MSKPRVLLSGPSLVGDEELITELGRLAEVVKNRDVTHVESTVAKNRIDLMLLEISKNRPRELEMIKFIKNRDPGIDIVILDGDGNRDAITRAFEYGAKDAFRKPYIRALIVERISALLEARDGVRG
jgi:DNA-binding NtrC family response regulator